MIGQSGSLQVGQFGPDGVYGQVNLLNQEGSAHVWDVKIPGAPMATTYGATTIIPTPQAPTPLTGAIVDSSGVLLYQETHDVRCNATCVGLVYVRYCGFQGD